MIDVNSVNITKSISKKRLIIEEGIILIILEYLFNSIYIFSIPIMTFVVFSYIENNRSIIQNYGNNESSFIQIIIYLISFIFSGFGIYAHFTRNKFIRIKGSTIQKNKQIIIQIAKDQKWHSAEIKDNYIAIDAREFPMYSNGDKQISVLLDESNLYINSYTKLRFGRSLFDWRSDRKYENIIKNEFIKKNKKFS